MTESEVEHIVSQTVFARGANRPFGELTVDDATARADDQSVGLGLQQHRADCGSQDVSAGFDAAAVRDGE